MDLNQILMWLAGMSCAATLLSILRMSFRNGSSLRDRAGWAVLSTAILLLMAFLWKSGNPFAGIVGGILWAVFLLIPSLATRIMSQALIRGRYDRASNAAWVIAILHPLDGLWSNARICRALRLANRGEVSAAAAILEKISRKRSAAARVAFIHLMRIERRWDELAMWWRSAGAREVRRFPAALPTILRSIGETGELNAMVETFERHQRMLESPQYAGVRALARLFVMAMCGRVQAVRAILSRELRDLREDMKQYWLGVAELSAGLGDETGSRLSEFAKLIEAGTRLSEYQSLASKYLASPYMAEEIAWRLKHPPAPAGALDPLLGEILDDDHAHREQEIRYASFSIRPRMTQAFVAMNLIYFAMEFAAGGTMNDAALLRVGVLDPSLVRHGQWWRLITANFMHYGPIHLGMNMIALLALGPFVEASVGGIFYLVAYMVCGIGAMAAVLEAQHLHILKEDVLLGASGAIMGLIGMTAAILLRGWMRERARVAARRLQIVVLIVLMQMIFDWMTPEVSSTAHMAGLFIGFFIALAWPGKAIGRRRNRMISPQRIHVPL